MTKINGVDTKVIENLVENYKKNPEEGMAGWSSSVKWKDGFYAEAQVGDHKPVLIDEPDWLSGSNKGPNPVELLLSGLGGCLSIGFIATASLMGIKVNSLEVNASGQLDLNVFLGLKEGNPGFNEINVQFTIDSDADDKQLEELVSKAMEISPVKNSLERNVQVNSTFKRNK
ncbi:OsmC family protein [Bacillus halotolerans]|uniref:OsmC family protein n=1 Tax=Bacillus halotolerans TaxID=260554 RepID=UPI001164924F|nr:OsmC family protein [Bacillus halotolerans]QDK66175.1 OsmC family protein [Bacillus halotolerans]UTL75349.1 OsmC family protein [Bacillus halotolerans]WPC79266.1 OsmC family protein [Bacillus halotolerans]